VAVLGGVLYVILFVIGTIVTFSGAPSGDAAPAKVIQWYSDSGHRDRILFLLWILVVSVWMFLRHDSLGKIASSM
jgi:hypothetical protein